ncbi:MAG: serine/threonine protein kinase [Acidobacteriia bacterium]|nr:serine/threonine protein kinase [Terriglobia bacterium]
MPEPDERDTATSDGSLTPERFAHVRMVFEAALGRHPSERRAYLEGACGGDKALLEEIEGMLSAEARHGALLDGNVPQSSAPEEGRFPAGTILAGRYRILGLLGQGGMGEVYKAFDLILNQTVALKFLSPTHISDAALNRFRNEVRIARQVSHPSVCRVYDLGMAEGLHFLSMEYIDGEDLASLLRRIGRLPQDKAIEFTRKICAGLAAAHERGVLHRDLKPANIMIDGRGQPRITDFGLAALAQEIPLSDLRSGTPAYMSPEQKAGKEVTTRSDIYSLGLVLHEMFTGTAPKDTQSAPSELVKDLDPVVDRLILRCLDDDPKQRPSSALGVAMALPGGDPIAAALAAGETPSPEMVAASGKKEGFSSRTAVLLVIVAVLGMIGESLLNGKNSVLSRAVPEQPPEALAFRAQEILQQLGYREKPGATAYGFEYASDYLSYLQEHHVPNRDALLASHWPAVVGFWYRQQQAPFLADAFLMGGLQFGAVSYDSPANTEPGMTRLLLDSKGRLFQLQVIPPSWSGTRATTEAPDWVSLFHLSGLDLSRFTPASPDQIPPMPFDARAAWTGTFSEGRTERVRVEAASWEGRPVYFSITGDWGRTKAAVSTGEVVLLFIVVALMAGAGWSAWNNLRLGRSDRRGAGRIATVIFFAVSAIWLLQTQHVGSFWELHLAILALSLAGFAAALIWSLYVAIEPHVRRYWPDSLISWTRFEAGRFRDPLVASHVLVGLSFRSLVVLYALRFAGSRLWGPWALDPIPLASLDSVPRFISELLVIVVVGTLVVIGLLFIVVWLRILIRRTTVADIAASILLGASALSTSAGVFENLALIALTALQYYWLIWILRHFGLLAGWIADMCGAMIWRTPLTFSSWYAGRSVALILFYTAIALWALWVIVAAERKSHPESAGA